MKILSILKNKAGFTLVQAIFILVVLSLLGVVMMRMIGVQSSTNVFALQGARAYQAARSGVEWGAAKARSADHDTDPCDDTICNSATPFPMDGFPGFLVDVSCSCQDFKEGPMDIDVYLISAIATFGNYGSPDFISRRVEMKVGFP